MLLCGCDLPEVSCEYSTCRIRVRTSNHVAACSNREIQTLLAESLRTLQKVNTLNKKCKANLTFADDEVQTHEYPIGRHH